MKKDHIKVIIIIWTRPFIEITGQIVFASFDSNATFSYVIFRRRYARVAASFVLLSVSR